MTSDPVGAALLIAAPFGLVGVFLLALIERMVPVLPSSGLFAAIGVAAAEGLWCLPTAVFASVIGSAIGALGSFQIGAFAAAIEPRHLVDLPKRSSRWIGRMTATCRRAAALPFTAQLLPATRTVTPFIGGAIRQDRTRFLLSTVAGLSIWNMTFIAAGFVLVRMGGPNNVTLISLMLGVAAAAIFSAGKIVLVRVRRPSSEPVNGNAACFNVR